MKIRYTLHAVERMKQRGISREEVEDCLSNPDKTLEQDRLLRAFTILSKCL